MVILLPERQTQLAARPAFAEAPVVLTAQLLLRRRADLAPAIRSGQLEFRFVASWEKLPEAVERIAADVVLVDLDAASETTDGRPRLSGYRLLTLLTRQLARRPIALVVITSLDFAEIEDLARAGIHALVTPDVPARALVAQMLVALDKVRGTRARPRRTLTPAPALASPREPAPSTAQPGDDETLAAVHPTGAASWRLSDTLWAETAPLLPPASPHARLTDRQIMDAVLRILRAGLTWSALPPGDVSRATVRRRLAIWRADGVFERLRALRLDARGILPSDSWQRLGLTSPLHQPAVRSQTR